MPTKHPRINVALEEPLYRIIRELAKLKGISMSMLTRELIKEAIEIEEDTLLTSFAEERENSLNKSQALNHDETWK
jgi:predicted DNA-binding ribbon-helix-helix protein